MRRHIATLAAASMLGIAWPTSAGAAAYPNAAECYGANGTVWLKTWAGKVATSGTHKGRWPMYGWMSGRVLNQDTKKLYTPTRLSLGGEERRVDGVQVTWIPKGYVSGALARWRVETPQSPTTSITCVTPKIGAKS